MEAVSWLALLIAVGVAVWQYRVLDELRHINRELTRLGGDPYRSAEDLGDDDGDLPG